MAHTGSSYVLASGSAATSNVTLIRVDPIDGHELGRLTVPNGGATAHAQLTPTPGGVLLSTAQGTSVAFGWLPEDVVHGAAALRAVFSGGSAVSSARTALVDSKGAAMVWQDGRVQVALLSCGP